MKRLSVTYISERLREQLKSIYSEKLTIISARNGCGKTFTVKEYIKQTRPVGYRCHNISHNISADDCFSRYCQIILGKSEHIPVTQADYIKLCGDFKSAVLKKPTLIVMDSPAAEQMILNNIYCAKLIMQYSPAPTTVLCTEIPDHYVHSPVYRNVKKIYTDDLLLTKGETAEYLSLCGITDLDTGTIYAHTDKQILSIRLCAYMHKSGITITDYQCDKLILDSIIKRVPPYIQFAAICTALYGKIDNALISDLIIQENISEYFGKEAISVQSISNGIDEINRIIPLIRINRHTGRYEPHITMQYALYRFFASLPETVRRELHYCRAKEYLRNGMTFRAFCQFYLAGDLHSAALVDKKSEPVSLELLMRNKELLFKFAMECPLIKGITPRLLRVVSLLMLTTYKDRLKYRYDELLEYISISPDYNDNERQSLLSYGYALRTYQDLYIIEKMGNHIKRAYEIFPSQKAFSPPFYSWSIYTPSVFSLIHRYSVPIKTEAEQFIRYHNMYTEMIDNGEYIDELYIAETHYMLGDLKIGLMQSEYVEAKCVGKHFIPTRLIALCTAARCAILLGNYQSYKNASDSITVLMKLYSTTEIGDMASLCLSLISCMKKGNTEEIWQQCTAVDSVVLLNRYTAPYCFFVRCFAMLLHKDCNTLLSVIDYYIQAAEDVRNETLCIMFRLSSAAAYYMQNKKKESLDTIRSVLDKIYNTGIVMPAVELCIHFPKIFELAADSLPQKYTPYIRKVLSFAEQMRRGVELIGTRELSELNSTSKSKEAIAKTLESSMNALESRRKDLGLTKAALKYAVLAAKNFSNEQIAKICSTSVDSVKSSLKRTFAKLGIHSRGQLKHIFKFRE